MYKLEMFLIYIYLKMFQDVDFKCFGNFFVCGVKKISWVYCFSIVYYDVYVIYFFFYFVKWKEWMCCRNLKFWG